jgi:hypothetical protein
MSAFNPDCDDLHEYFYTSFVEMWEFNSSPSEREDGIHMIDDYRAALGKTDKFIDWVREQIELSITDDKYFIGAVINTLDIDGLMAKLNDWMDEHTCAECHLVLSECECDSDSDSDSEYEPESVKCYECNQATKVNTGARCGSCHIKYCDDCIIDVSKDNDWTLTHVCKDCKEGLECVFPSVPGTPMSKEHVKEWLGGLASPETPPTIQAGPEATKAC